MEEDDHDELLQCTDDESMSESDDQCLPTNKQEDAEDKQIIRNYTVLQFLLLKFTLILSSLSLIILLPLYLEANNVKGNSYTMISLTNVFTFLLYSFIFFIAKTFFPSYKYISLWKSPLQWGELFKVSFLYTLSAFFIIYANSEKKVMCHLQDPIKGIVLVFSLIFYFFFCTKLMGLQRIFSTTTVIVGLFISVDYGLCDEFRCRGFERERRTDDAGPWNWQVHSIWATVYVAGLALFAAYYTFLDRFMIPLEVSAFQTTVTTSLLTTISRLVSFQTTNNSFLSEIRPFNSTPRPKNQHSFIHLGFWIHLASLILIAASFWVDLIPHVGKSENMKDFLNKTLGGLVCHFSLYSSSKVEYTNCGNVSLYAWLFIFSYLIFSMSSTMLLILTQSAVYTIATMTISLPLVGIWWSLFRMVPIEKGLIIWAPSVTGELICALLGLPIVLTGLALLCKSHLKNSRNTRINEQPSSQSTFA